MSAHNSSDDKFLVGFLSWLTIGGCLSFISEFLGSAWFVGSAIVGFLWAIGDHLPETPVVPLSSPKTNKTEDATKRIDRVFGLVAHKAVRLEEIEQEHGRAVRDQVEEDMLRQEFAASSKEVRS